MKTGADNLLSFIDAASATTASIVVRSNTGANSVLELLSGTPESELEHLLAAMLSPPLLLT